MDRRSFIAASTLGAGAFLGLRLVDRDEPGPSPRAVPPRPYGPLRPPDPQGIQLPRGFRSRVVATSGRTVEGTSYTWHRAPDGGACFPTDDGGWIYVSNSELADGAGGAGALRFSSSGSITDAYRILDGTDRNCAGGPTPWGTWLSCEETEDGQVWECDPTGRDDAVVRPAMGSFTHEAAACDPVRGAVYLTEDSSTGKLRRFRPETKGDLSSGTLEVAVVDGSTVRWTTTESAGTEFDGGEGAWYGDGKVWCTTKGDNRVWELDVATSPNTIQVLYDPTTFVTPTLVGVDNIVGSASGDLFVAEDGGDMELVVVEPSGAVKPFLRVLGQSGSELAGPAFSPDGTRLYVSSQRGGDDGDGITYEVTGPFRTKPGKVGV